MTGDEAIQRYYARLAERSDESARQLCIEARVFLRFAGAARIQDVTLGQVNAYRAHLAGRAARVPKGKRLALSTLASYLTHLRIFLLFCAAQDWLSIPADAIRAATACKAAHVERPYEVLSEEEIRRVMAVADARQKALLTLGLNAGLRVGEMARLTVGDIMEDATRALTFVRVQRGKGNKDRTVQIARDVYDLLRSYCGARRGDAPLFTIGRYQCRKVIVQAIRAASITRRITPHSLRHTYAYRLAKANVPVLVIKNLLGHSKLETTLRYIEHLTESDVAQYAPSLVK